MTRQTAPNGLPVDAFGGGGGGPFPPCENAHMSVMYVFVWVGAGPFHLQTGLATFRDVGRIYRLEVGWYEISSRGRVLQLLGIGMKRALECNLT